MNQVLLVDNASSDGSAEALQQNFGPDLLILALEKNLGYAGGLNVGIRSAIRNGSEWVFVVNNDTWVAKDFFENLFNQVKNHPAYSIYGPQIFYADNPTLVWNLGDRLLPGTLLTINRYKNRLQNDKLPGIVPVDIISGCAMLVHTRVFEKVGYFDESFFMYGEEVDWCLRARRFGFRLAAIPGAHMWHKVSASSKQLPQKSWYLKTRNQIWVYRRNGNKFQKLSLFAFSLCRSLFISIKEWASGRETVGKSVMNGWKDGWWKTPQHTNESPR